MKKLFMILSIMATAACSWHSPDSTFYVMDSKGLRTISDKNINVTVTRVKVPDMLNKTQMIISSEDSTQVKVMEYERWGESYPEIIQSTVTNDLIAYLPNAYVKRTFFDSENTQYNVNIEVNKLQAYQGDKVILSAWWNITDAKGNILQKAQGSYEAKVVGDDIQDLVNAQALAVHQMSEEIAISLASAKK